MFLKEIASNFCNWCTTGVLLVYPTIIRIPCWLLREDIAPNAPETKKKGSFHEGTYGIVFSHVFPLCFVPKARSTWSWCRSHGRVFGQGCPRRGGWGVKMAPRNRRFLLETIIFRFHVKLGECLCVQLIHRRKPSRTCNCSGHIPGHGICGGGYLGSPVEWFLKLTFWQKLWCI